MARAPIPIATKANTTGNLKRVCPTAREHYIPMARCTKESLKRENIMAREPLPILTSLKR